ncbi:hypothetical protein N7281_01075 [Rickettsia hoogstraalii]|uniref:hypothetical protein n=1 Tax=Rickettsia hoogstraalii TaxID=467174 RepID=UPI00225542A2|nr:hypothetical protein [Rickettsia hoogstraalii]MCX4083492.1 hypothetical protein [Rickettsia hoogstraalii]
MMLFLILLNCQYLNDLCYITLIFGTARVNGKIIWADTIKEVANSTRHKEYFLIFIT